MCTSAEPALRRLLTLTTLGGVCVCACVRACVLREELKAGSNSTHPESDNGMQLGGEGGWGRVCLCCVSLSVCAEGVAKARRIRLRSPHMNPSVESLGSQLRQFMCGFRWEGHALREKHVALASAAFDFLPNHATKDGVNHKGSHFK